MDRRSFLSMTACGMLRVPSVAPQLDHVSEQHWQNLGYRATRVLGRVNQIFAQRNPPGDGLRLQFVDYETMPAGDVTCVVPCASAELGVLVVGSVAYELSLWLQQRTSDVEALITLKLPAAVLVLEHHERGRDIVLMLRESTTTEAQATVSGS